LPTAATSAAVPIPSITFFLCPSRRGTAPLAAHHLAPTRRPRAAQLGGAYDLAVRGEAKNSVVNAAIGRREPAYDPHNRLLAMAAPSLSARSFAQTMLSVTFGSLSTAVPKPQSTPAMNRSRSMIPA